MQNYERFPEIRSTAVEGAISPKREMGLFSWLFGGSKEKPRSYTQVGSVYQETPRRIYDTPTKRIVPQRLSERQRERKSESSRSPDSGVDITAGYMFGSIHGVDTGHAANCSGGSGDGGGGGGGDGGGGGCGGGCGGG